MGSGGLPLQKRLTPVTDPGGRQIGERANGGQRGLVPAPSSLSWGTPLGQGRAGLRQPPLPTGDADLRVGHTECRQGAGERRAPRLAYFGIGSGLPRDNAPQDAEHVFGLPLSP